MLSLYPESPTSSPCTILKLQLECFQRCAACDLISRQSVSSSTWPWCQLASWSVSKMVRTQPERGPSIWASASGLCSPATTHFFVILLSDFMPGRHIHKINHSYQIQPDLGRLKLVDTLPRAVRKFLSICLACLSIDGDLSIKSRPREATYPFNCAQSRGLFLFLFLLRIFLFFFCTLEDLKLSSGRVLLMVTSKRLLHCHKPVGQMRIGQRKPI